MCVCVCDFLFFGSLLRVQAQSLRRKFKKLNDHYEIFIFIARKLTLLGALFSSRTESLVIRKHAAPEV